MPYIFPKRFLRTNDVLDPESFQSDFDEAKILLDEGLDRHNLKSVAFKHLEGDAGQAIEDGDKPYVEKGAYYKMHHTRVECRTRIEYDADVFRNTETNAGRRTPNFVRPDGLTFRDSGINVGPNQGKPYVVPHTGEWSVVQNADLTGPMQLTFESKNKSNLWLCAYLQYVWQGFFEYKKPWITEDYTGWKQQFSLFEGGATGAGWAAAYDPDGRLAQEEAAVLNHFGPSEAWSHYPTESTRGSGYVVTKHPYSFPLSEVSGDVESSFPNLGGFHHISRGFYPCLVQFALRVDGEIIDETITGKQFSAEESAHGLKVQDGPIYEINEEADDGTDDGKKRYDHRAQRSHARNSSYGSALNASAAGQKLRTSRSVALGPECGPVRIGAVVPLDPGNHTVELVARRISRKKSDFGTGDFVGVFSRRLLAIELPVAALETEPDSEQEFLSSPPFETEQFLEGSDANSLLNKHRYLAGSFSQLTASAIRPNSLPNTHLPSKIVVSKRKAITTTRTSTVNPLERGRGQILTPPTDFRSDARFPGFPRGNSDLNKLTKRAGGPGSAGAGQWSDRAGNTAGWDFVKGGTSNLSISDSNLSITKGRNSLLIMADIELLQLNGKRSNKAQTAQMSDSMGKIRDYTSFIQDDKYLDLFAYFAIGYRTGDTADDWIIASSDGFRPAMVNSFNWVNRNDAFVSEVGENLSRNNFTDWDLTPGGTFQPPMKTETSFTVGVGQSGEVDRRGGNTLPSGYGVNLPLMAFIDETTTIKEVAVFVCSSFPTIWDDRHALYGDTLGFNARRVKVPGTTELEPVTETWKSPVNGRGILSGTEVMWGDCSLSVLKFNS